ncbi:MAG: hypothetical protein LBJ47_03125 [Tannerella sp.]|nr:hypothetical protein [Tannerella sp.]
MMNIRCRWESSPNSAGSSPYVRETFPQIRFDVSHFAESAGADCKPAPARRLS